MKQIFPYMTLMLDISLPIPLYRQLYQQIKENILNSTLKLGTRLPSSRELAKTLEISRNTVITAFDQLLAEGYLESKLGAGTYVTSKLVEVIPKIVNNNKSTFTEENNFEHKISKRGELISKTKLGIKDRFGMDLNKPKPFQICLPSCDDFPFELWSKLAAKQWRYPKYDMLNYSDPGGYYPLRQVIAEYLIKTRAVRCIPEQIIITIGAHNAFDLISKVLFDPGDSMWMEDPGFNGTRAIFQSMGVNIVPIQVDEEGLNVCEGISRCSFAKAAYITPSHQFPLGITMSLKRRLALLEWAQTHKTWIIEDDYVSEFRYFSKPIAALQGLDNIGCVIYVGTFSKVLLPALRIAYIVVPENLIDVFLTAKALSCRCSNPFEQATLTEFINEGYFDQHLRRMLKLYKERQNVLVHTINTQIGDLVSINSSPSGMHLIVWLAENINDQKLAECLENENICTVPISSCSLTVPTKPGLMLGYTSFTNEEIIDTANKFVKVIKEYLNA